MYAFRSNNVKNNNKEGLYFDYLERIHWSVEIIYWCQNELQKRKVSRWNFSLRANASLIIIVSKLTVFFNDVCLTANDVGVANDDGFAWCFLANIASLRVKRATSYLRSKCIISPQAILHKKTKSRMFLNISLI